LAGAQRLAHRLVYEKLVGPIPDGVELDHVCRRRLCVNPAHLDPVTHRINVLRGTSFSAVNAAKTASSKGHPLDEKNTYRMKDGGRSCRACTADAARRYRARRRIKETT
jgi:hypothetical protein